MESTVFERLIPDLHVNSIYDIDLYAMQRRGVKAIITDLDNTLVEWDRPDATEKLVKWLQQVQQIGFKVVIVSNNNEIRVGAFARPLGVPFIHQAKKPMNTAFKKAIKMMDVKTEETVVIGDQLFTDILGGNLMGLYTILVIPVASSDGFFTKFNRRMERIALSWLRKRGKITWED